jgi:hypothetical protein
LSFPWIALTLVGRPTVISINEGSSGGAVNEPHLSPSFYAPAAKRRGCTQHNHD